MNIGEKWKRLGRELFDFFESEMMAQGLEVTEKLSPWYATKIQELYKCGINEGDLREVISFCVKNWEAIRDLDDDGKRLDSNPNLLQVFGPYRFAKFCKLAREGIKVKTTVNDEVWDRWKKK